MCIAIIKPMGEKSPTMDAFKNSFDSNKDGAGFSFNYNDMIYVRKGLMTFEAFEDAYLKCYKGFSLDYSTVFIHFRIATAGGVSEGNTHPFPVVKDFDEMKKVNNLITKGFVGMHNGILQIESSKDASDTMHYFQTIAGLDFWSDERIQKLVALSTSGSKVAFLNRQGKFQYYGSWLNDSGCLFSNTSYKTTPTMYTCYGGEFWREGNKVGYQATKVIKPKRQRRVKHTCADCLGAIQCFAGNLDEARKRTAQRACFERMIVDSGDSE